jgi:hypothetical protein
MGMARLRSTARWLVIVSTWSVVSSARAQSGSAQQAVEELNRQAMEAYNALDINKAGATLEQALRVAASGGVTAQLVARTTLNLGIVYVGGLNDQNNGLNYFLQAVCTDPSSQLDPLTSSPEIQNVFNAAVQRARSGACPTGGGAPPGSAPAPYVAPAPPPPPQPTAPPPDQAIAHQVPAEQVSQTPLPLYAEINPLAQAKKILLHYKGLGMTQFKQVPMYRYQSGFAYQISCGDVWEPKVSYYIEATSADGRVVGAVGSSVRPIEVPVVAVRRQGEPSLPGAQAPASYANKECPPGVQGCTQPGKKAIGDSCDGNGECQSGLECRDDACMLIGGGGTNVPEYNPTTGSYEESPETEHAASGDLKPTFIQLGLTAGLAYVQAGMVADHPPPDNRVFVDPTGAFIENPYAAATAVQALQFPEPGTPTEGKVTAWVPDADSGDSVGPLKGNCAADGKPSGPALAILLPTKYCVRVKSPGFVPNLALRAAIGHFVTPRISLAALMRFQFSAGQGTLSHMLLGARVEYLLSQPKAKGLMLSAFAGGSFGQIQAQPPAPDNSKHAPFVVSGLLGAHVGMNLRYRLSPSFGLFASPEIDVQLPTFLANVDLTLAGVEAAF